MEEELEALPSKTYKIVNGRIAGFIDELAAMRQTVEKILATERFEYMIYSENYGVELADLIGEHVELVKLETERVVKEALGADDRILAIDNFQIIEEKSDTLVIEFVVHTVFGNLRLEQEVLL